MKVHHQGIGGTKVHQERGIEEAGTSAGDGWGGE